VEKSRKESTKRNLKAAKENIVQNPTEEVTKDEFTDEDFYIEEVAKDEFTDEDFYIEEVAKDEFSDEDLLLEEAEKDDIKIWYYIDKGEIIGAFSKSEMLSMYHRGTIKETTEVWNKTMSDWMELKQTTLTKKKSLSQKNKALHKVDESEINNSLVWILAFVPLLLAGAVYLKSLPFVIILIVIHVAICITDANLLINAKQMKKSMLLMAVFLTPVYLVQRAKAIKKGILYLPIWSIFCIIVVILCARLYVTDIRVKAEPKAVTVSDETVSNQNTSDAKEITVKQIVEKYITNPKYDLQTQENKESLLTVSGTLNYEGAAQAAVLQFRVKSDGSVHFEQMSIDGKDQNDSVYKKMITEMRAD
jgi:hypothetical protein